MWDGLAGIERDDDRHDANPVSATEAEGRVLIFACGHFLVTICLYLLTTKMFFGASEELDNENSDSK